MVDITTTPDATRQKDVPEFGAFMAAAPIATLVCNSTLHPIYANQATIDLLSRNLDEILALPLHHLLKTQKDTIPDNPGAHDFSGAHILTNSDGTEFWGRISVAPYQSGDTDDDTSKFWIIQITNIDVQKRELEEITYKESIWRNAIVASNHGVWDYNADTNRRFYSKEWKRIRGFPVDEEVCDTLEAWEARIHPDDLDNVREHVRQHNSGELPDFSYEYRERRADGCWIWILSRGRAVEWDQNGFPTRMTGTDVDISSIKEEEILRHDEAELAYEKHVQELEKAQQVAEAAHRIAHSMSRQDPLTGLPNRRVFSEHLSKLTGKSDYMTTPFAVLLVDLDKFKPINDIYGHTAGDHVICQIADRLEKINKDNGIVARLGGDEFGVIVTGTPNSDIESQAQMLATTIIDEIEKPILFDNIHANVGASVGIALFPDHGASASSLFHAADLAMYHVKKNGRGAWGLFNVDLDVEMKAKAKLESDTRQAVMDREIAPYFQPVINLTNNQISGFEILARWNHPTFGFVAPDLFIPIIEQFGLIKEFSVSILRQACLSARDWPAHLKISLNISAEEVIDSATPLRIANILADCNFLPTRLEIEVTETALIKDFTAAKQVINTLRESGIRVLLDDFGTGNSGLHYLRDLKVDCLKIDRSFIMSMGASSESHKIVLSMLALAKSLGLETVAEGIEDAKNHQIITEGNGTYGQGFHYSEAIPASEVPAFIRYCESEQSSQRAG